MSLTMLVSFANSVSLIDWWTEVQRKRKNTALRAEPHMTVRGRMRDDTAMSD